MIKPCKRCGILFQAYGSMKYCAVCSYEVKLEYHREYHRRHRAEYLERERRYRANRRECYREYWRQYYRRQKLKLIREFLSAEAVKRDD